MALIQCPECGGTLSNKAAVCPHCGKKMTPVSAGAKDGEYTGPHFCPACGTALSGNDRVCPGCSFILAKTSSNEEDKAGTDEKRETRAADTDGTQDDKPVTKSDAGAKKIKCRICASEVPAGTKLCPVCGARIKKSRWWIWVLAGLITAFAAFAALGFILSDTDEDDVMSPKTQAGTEEAVKTVLFTDGGLSFYYPEYWETDETDGNVEFYPTYGSSFVSFGRYDGDETITTTDEMLEFLKLFLDPDVRQEMIAVPSEYGQAACADDRFNYGGGEYDGSTYLLYTADNKVFVFSCFEEDELSDKLLNEFSNLVSSITYEGNPEKEEPASGGDEGDNVKDEDEIFNYYSHISGQTIVEYDGTVEMLSDYSCSDPDKGLVHVMMVQNTSSGNAIDVESITDILNEKGEIIGHCESHGGISRKGVPAEGSGIICEYAKNIPEGEKVTFKTEIVAKEAKEAKQKAYIGLDEVKLDNSRFTGEAVNNSGNAVEDIEIYLLYFDENGELIHFGIADIDSTKLKPDESTNFSYYSIEGAAFTRVSFVTYARQSG